MHAETLAYMLHQLTPDRKIAPASYKAFGYRQTGLPVVNRMIDIPSGIATLGIPRSGESFGWDNEFDEHSVHVPPFAIDTHKVTNGEFLNFVRAGGYDDPQFWSDADWAWIKDQNIAHPRLLVHAS